jgi:hypothetical protein
MKPSSAVASTTTVSTNLEALYKALGGGWETTFPAAADAAGERPLRGLDRGADLP